MLPFNLALLVFRSTLGMGAAELTLPSHYWDGMVFQADQDQTMIWGFTTDETLMIKARTNGFIWEVIYDEVRNNGDVCHGMCHYHRTGRQPPFLGQCCFGGSVVLLWTVHAEHI